jgi:hypothetical protein
MIDDLMKRKIFSPYCIEAIRHCMLPEAVIPVARYINSINIRIIRLGRYYDKPNQETKYAETFCVETELVHSYSKYISKLKLYFYKKNN